MHAFYEVRLSFHALIISYIGNIVNIINKLLFLSRLYLKRFLVVLVVTIVLTWSLYRGLPDYFSHAQSKPPVTTSTL